MGNLRERVLGVYRTIVTIFFLAIITLICAYNATSTAYLINWEHTVYVKDSIFGNLIAAVGFVVILYFFADSKYFCSLKKATLSEDTFQKWKYRIIISIFLVSSIWALSTQFIPGVDEYAVQSIVREALNSDFHSFEPLAYMDLYPNQWGFFLFSYFIALVFGGMNYIVLELVIAMAIAFSFKELSELASLIGVGRVGQLSVLVIGLLYVPFSLYSEMVYGNMLGVMFSLAAIKHEMLFFKFGRKQHLIKTAIYIALGALLKSNMQIFFLAIVFSGMINILKMPKRAFCLLAAVITAYAVQSCGVAAIIRYMTGCQLESPITPFAWIAMGLQDGDLAPGWWNSYTVNSYYECGGNTVLHSLMVKANIKESIMAFLEAPSSGVEFFTKKILSTWTNPTFQCFGTVRNGAYIETPKWVDIILSYQAQRIIAYYLNVFSFLIYFGALLFIGLSNLKNTDKLILPMVFIGGFLFHLLWETKARYALMYYIVLIPCAIRGYSCAVDFLRRIIKRENSSILLCDSNVKIRIFVVLMAVLAFTYLYAGRFGYILLQDTDTYKEYIQTASWSEHTTFMGQ